MVPTAVSHIVISKDNKVLRRKLRRKHDISCLVRRLRRAFNALTKASARLTMAYQPITPIVKKWVWPPFFWANSDKTIAHVLSYVIRGIGFWSKKKDIAILPREKKEQIKKYHIRTIFKRVRKFLQDPWKMNFLFNTCPNCVI